MNHCLDVKGLRKQVGEGENVDRVAAIDQRAHEIQGKRCPLIAAQ